jgi:site-specific DNA-adenine methylase
MRPLHPFKPLKPAEGYGKYEFDDIDEVIANFASDLLEEEGELAVEPKWDGIRLVVHYDGERVAAYTEDKQRDRAEILPALVEEIQEKFGNRSVILDGEILLGRTVDGKFMPVMRPDTMRVVVGKEPITDPIRYEAFDVLYLDGEDIHKKPFRERRNLLANLFDSLGTTKVLELTEQRIVKSVEELRDAIEWASNFTGSEGAMIKSLESEYETDGRTTYWAKYKRWKAIKCLIIGISKVFPPNTDPDEWREAFKQSRTYIFRCAVYGPDGKTLIPIESKRTLTESDMQLRYVRAGEEDPVTGKVASKSEWRGRDDPRLWEMDERFVREPGDFALGQTYAIKVEDGEPKLGDVVEVAPIALNWFEDDEGYMHLTWMHPKALGVGIDDQSEVAGWDRVTELVLASGQEMPEVKVIDGKLKIVKQAVSIPSIVIASEDNDDEEDRDEDEPKKQMLPRIFKEAFGVGLPRSVVKACVAVLPDDYKTYIELFAGASCGLLRWKDRRPDETEILIDIDPFVVAFLKVLKSGDWRKLRRFRWNPSKERWFEIREAIREGDYDDAPILRKAYAFAYTTFYSRSNYGPSGSYSPIRRYEWRKELELVWDRCARWEQRLKGVRIYCMDAFDAMEKFDAKDTFFFADPPWVTPSVMKKGDKPFYTFAWEIEDHERFIEACSRLKGRILILNQAFAKKFTNLGSNWNYRVFTYVTGHSPWTTLPENVKRDRALKGNFYRHKIYLIANYELPEIPSAIKKEALMRSADSAIERLVEEEELTHEKQRLEEERRLGDPYKVRHDVKHFEDGYEFVFMRHYRGLWSDSERSAIVKRLKEWKAAGSDRRREIWDELVKDFHVLRLTVDIDTLIERAQKASDERRDVSKVIDDALSDEMPEDVDAIDDLIGEIVNLASLHGDLRIVNPAQPKTQLIGWTLTTPPAAIQFLDGEIVPVLRDKFLNYQEGDRIVAVRKARQPKVWLTVVTSSEPLLWAPPGAAGSTPGTWALFEWKANGVVWFGVQRPDYHEMWFKFEEYDDDAEPLDGKWVARLLKGEGPKIGKGGEYWQFWYPEDQGQLPYVLTHTPEQARNEWKDRRYEYVILNLDVVPVILEQFPEINELLQSSRKAQKMLEQLDRWLKLEKE